MITDSVRRALAAQTERADVAVLDPPRSGAGREVIDLLAAAEVPRVIHIGCEAASFARDVGLYLGHGYAVEDLRVFDSFPLTHHVECVAVLTRWRRTATSRLSVRGDRFGGVGAELVGDDDDAVGGKSAAAGVLADGVLVVGLVDAVDLVARDVAGDPPVRHAERRDDVVGLGGDLGQLRPRLSSLAPGISRSMT